MNFFDPSCIANTPFLRITAPSLIVAPSPEKPLNQDNEHFYPL